MHDKIWVMNLFESTNKTFTHVRTTFHHGFSMYLTKKSFIDKITGTYIMILTNFQLDPNNREFKHVFTLHAQLHVQVEKYNEIIGLLHMMLY